MGKLVSEKERKLQKKLIPLNIFVCILALVAAISLMFAPIFKIDFGKILRSEAITELVDESMDKALGSSETADGQVDFMSVISTVVSNVFGSAEGSISITAYDSSKVAFSSGDNKAEKVLDDLFFGDKGLINKLIDSIADNVVELFNSQEGKDIIEEVVVSAIVSSLATGVSGEVADKFTDEHITELTDTFRKFDDVTDRNSAESVATEFVDKLEEILGDDFNESDGDTVHNYIMDMYDDAEAEAVDFSFETMVSIAVSKNIDLSNFNIGNAFGNGNNEGEPAGSVPVKRVAEEEIGGEETEPSQPVNPDESEPTEPSNPEEPVEPSQPVDPVEPEEPSEPTEPEEPSEPGDNTGEADGDRVICTSYNELLAQMGLDEENIDNLKATLKTTLQDFVNGYVSEASGYFDYYGYIFYGMLAFIVPWLILFLFSFFHMFAKNKRFMMWYVKLYSFIPGLISLAIILAPKLLPKFAPGTLESEAGSIIKALLSGISSMMWISGICYVLLWLVSIFWAFPIKHKIRKERKMVKQYGASYDSGYSGNKKKDKVNKKAAKKSGYYQANDNYGGDTYGSNYGNDYGNSYGGSSYGNDLYGGNAYGSGYGGSYGSDYDDDLDGFDSPYTGDFFGGYGSYDEEDY